MPRFEVIEVRACYSGVIIDAANEEAAQRYDGSIIDEAKTDTWGERLHSCQQVEDDREEVELP